MEGVFEAAQFGEQGVERSGVELLRWRELAQFVRWVTASVGPLLAPAVVWKRGSRRARRRSCERAG